MAQRFVDALAESFRAVDCLMTVPPDADSLGLMLELAAATGAARDRAETWTALLLANTDENGVARRFSRGS